MTTQAPPDISVVMSERVSSPKSASVIPSTSKVTISMSMTTLTVTS